MTYNTINKNNRFLNRCLVGKLGFKKLSGKEGTLLCALIPSNMKMVHIKFPKMTHHLHLVFFLIKVFIKILREGETIGYFQCGVSHQTK